ncbi:MAG: NAD(P)/FAD-dependent oxidoreductase, partial [Desulfuromonadales bacterium]|nr:NAD(P)/FAD-dependent oxidoreductase [Desulfuromonadales bacterium]
VREAEYLARFAAEVLLITTAPQLETALPDKVQVLTNSQVVAILGKGNVTAVKVRHRQTGQEQERETDGVFLYLYGALPSVEFLNASLPLGEKSCVLTHSRTETSIPGVYAAGDVTCTQARQVVVSAACGCVAALAAEKFLRHRSKERYDWDKQ